MATELDAIDVDLLALHLYETGVILSDRTLTVEETHLVLQAYHLLAGDTPEEP